MALDTNRFVLFDFDGVIADSFSAAYKTANTYCTHKTEESYKKQFETNIWESENDLVTGDHSACKHDLNWWETFVPIFESESTLFPHMDEVVRKLAGQYRMVIISSSVKHAIESFLKKHGLEDCFEEILDSDVHRSKRVKIDMVFEKYGVDASTCIMVTDSKGDVDEARDRGVDSIGVTWGYNGRAPLMAANPWRIIELPVEIPNAVNEFFHGKGTAA